MTNVTRAAARPNRQANRRPSQDRASAYPRLSEKQGAASLPPAAAFTNAKWRVGEWVGVVGVVGVFDVFNSGLLVLLGPASR